MKREITLLILGMVMSCVLAACGNANTGKDETEKAKTSEVVEEVEINKDNCTQECPLQWGYP